MPSLRRGRNSAVLSSVRWLLAALLAWGLVRLLGNNGSAIGEWPAKPFELLALIVMPSLAAFATIRLFLATVQTGSGSLNTYTVTSSPWSLVFWLFLSIALLGQGSHLTAAMLEARLPDVIRNGDFAENVDFFNRTLGFWLLGTGFFAVSAVLLVLGRGAGPQVFGGEALLLSIGSLLTYGYAVVYIGTYAGLLLPAIVGGIILSILGLWSFGPYELSRDPVALLIVPGTATGAAALIVWSLVIGGRPSWPF